MLKRALSDNDNRCLLEVHARLRLKKTWDSLKLVHVSLTFSILNPA